MEVRRSARNRNKKTLVEETGGRSGGRARGRGGGGLPRGRGNGGNGAESEDRSSHESSSAGGVDDVERRKRKERDEDEESSDGGSSDGGGRKRRRRDSEPPSPTQHRPRTPPSPGFPPDIEEDELTLERLHRAWHNASMDEPGESGGKKGLRRVLQMTSALLGNKHGESTNI